MGRRRGRVHTTFNQVHSDQPGRKVLQRRRAEPQPANKFRFVGAGQGKSAKRFIRVVKAGILLAVSGLLAN